MSNEISINKKLDMNQVKKIANDSSEKIKLGLSRKVASTGKPMNELKGGAKFMASMSNIGGGSKNSGGDGVFGGLDTIMKNRTADTILKVTKHTQIKNIESKK